MPTALTLCKPDEAPHRNLSRCLRLAACVLGLAFAGESPADVQRLHRYEISIDEALNTLSVRACFDGMPPAELVAESLDAPLALIEARIEGARKPIEPSGALPLKQLAANGCLRYQVNVSRPIRRHDRTDGKVRRQGSDLLTSTALWLWRPALLAPDEDIELTFLLRDGLSVSAPWMPREVTPGRAVFRLGHAPHDELGYVAFGRFKEREVRVGEARLRLAVLEGSPPVDPQQMEAWLADAANIVAGLHGRFPVPQAQVLVVPDARGNEPTPLAVVARGGAPAVHFFVNQRRPIEEFYDDWTAVHEFSHLLLPLINRNDAWLYEGVATYYQTVLRARAGRIPVDRAWNMMHAGFQRGMEDADGSGMTLAQATENMYRNGPYMRVYWEGAALMLMADVQLRLLSDNRQSLDTALAGVLECCGSAARPWSARELIERLDAITGTDVFGVLYERHVASHRFPDLAPVYRALGLVAQDRTTVELSPAGRELREAIMRPFTPAPTGMEEIQG